MLEEYSQQMNSRYSISRSLDLLWAVVLIVALASLALLASEDLSTNTGPVSDLELLHVLSNVRDLSDDLVTWADPVSGQLAPAASDGVDIRAADTTALDVDGHIIGTGSLEGKLLNGEVGVVLGVYTRPLANIWGRE